MSRSRFVNAVTPLLLAGTMAQAEPVAFDNRDLAYLLEPSLFALIGLPGLPGSALDPRMGPESQPSVGGVGIWYDAPASPLTSDDVIPAFVRMSDLAGGLVVGGASPIGGQAPAVFQEGDSVGPGLPFTPASLTTASFSFATFNVPYLGDRCILGFSISEPTGVHYGFVEMVWLERQRFETDVVGSPVFLSYYAPSYWAYELEPGMPIVINIPDRCVADVTEDGFGNGEPDGLVTLSDFSYYLSLWATDDPQADITMAGTCDLTTSGGGVDLSDFSCYLSQWSLGCP